MGPTMLLVASVKVLERTGSPGGRMEGDVWGQAPPWHHLGIQREHIPLPCSPPCLVPVTPKMTGGLRLFPVPHISSLGPQ